MFRSATDGCFETRFNQGSAKQMAVVWTATLSATGFANSIWTQSWFLFSGFRYNADIQGHAGVENSR